MGVGGDEPWHQPEYTESGGRYIVLLLGKKAGGIGNFSLKESSLIVCATEADKCQKDRSFCLQDTVLYSIELIAK